MRIVLTGPPGSGKGTQAQMLSNTLHVPHISTGELFRQHISQQSELGRVAKGYIDVGELVPSAVTVEMVRHRLTDEAAQSGFLLDGFPRTVEQAMALDEILNQQNRLTAVLDFQIAEDEVVARMLARGRADDTEEVIRTRLRVYRAENQPLQDHYAPILLTVDAHGSLDEVHHRALSALRARFPVRRPEDKGGRMRRQ